MDQKFENLPPPNDSFSAPYGYFENLPERTLRRLHAENHSVRQLSPLWRFRWSGLTLLMLIAVMTLSRLNNWNTGVKEKNQVASFEAALFELPESSRIDYLLSSYPSPDPHWLSATELSDLPIIESDIAAEVLDQYSAASLPLDYEWALMTEMEVTELP